MEKALKISEADNVAVALQELAPGESFFGVELLARIPAGHKFALKPLAKGSAVLKYGSSIGRAKNDVRPGEWIHTHNLESALSGEIEYRYEPETPARRTKPRPELEFDGFLREDGRVGIRNEIWIIPASGCVNKIAARLAAEASAKLSPGCGVDGVYAFEHPYGCSQLGADHEATRKILANLAKHPNAAGTLVLSLGCENNCMGPFLELIGSSRRSSLRSMVAQEADDEIAEGRLLLQELFAHAQTAKRVSLPVSKLVVGLKCGGSDGFSGITANPLLGRVADILGASGATPVLTEVPEMFGAEFDLMNRCVSKEVFQKCAAMVNGFKRYFMRYGQTVYENPSPGNKAGGISTLEEKSLGCVQKGGRGQVCGVAEYGERVETRGLNLLCGPGNDIVATTALAAAGAQLVLFTTGRGTPLGGPVPTLKVSANSTLAKRKPDWIDFDAGTLLSGDSFDAASERLLALVLDLASGRVRTKNELNAYREIAIFKDGATL